MSETTRHKEHEGAKDPAHPHPGARMPKIPDKTTLGYATLFALLVAGSVLLLVVLPAEYGIDPTNFGRITGISRLSGESAELDLGDRTSSIHRQEPGLPRNDTVVLTLNGLGDDLEYKFHLLANQTLLYTWTASANIEFDFHGDPDNPSQPGEFSSYDKGQAMNGSGSFQAPFAGRHGWYFRDIGNEPVTITLHTWGYYDVVGRLF